jgi:tetratricopeptide (TPR) repeat protein
MAEADPRELYEKGLAQQRAGQAKAALQIFTVLLKRVGPDATLYVRAGECWEMLGDFARADDAYRRAIARDPKLDLARRRATVARVRRTSFGIVPAGASHVMVGIVVGAAGRHLAGRQRQNGGQKRGRGRAPRGRR